MSGLNYIGKGAFVPGMYPARDLTAEEVKLFGEEALLATGLYKKTSSSSSSNVSKPAKVETDAVKDKES